MKALVEVAIGLIFSQRQVLVGWREAKQHQGNKYEFPGGKLEPGESAVQACRREILEEVGVDIQLWHPFEWIEHDYADVVVRLHVFFAVLDAEQAQQVKQPWQWYERKELQHLNFPKANAEIIERLSWPTDLKVSQHIAELDHVEASTLFYFRPEQWTDAETQAVMNMPPTKHAQLILNEAHWKTFAQPNLKLAAIHLKHSQLMQKTKGDLVVGQRYIAACHNEESLKHAQSIGCEAMLFSPILATPSHPNTQALGWQYAQQVLQNIHLPVFALGGMRPETLPQAQHYGFYGVAGVSAF
ncbi:NUDIX domain-containing protein [Acinetobacter sp. MD2(2019)]|uniref:NUDIX domain-containing protein n=1 Tax=Acinetobacter sp. MD2(2019) TaxID=2605273 RepID=UPI002D1F1D66|nr:NUDIX domain-containing protein [Acinetobacter sp. MD2(2019)]MEB3754106.1 thiamine phosphate synthase [Acinetobacter sp. MD2(2019)]